MQVLTALVVTATGVAAGAINAVVGSGTLITFPTLLAMGYPAVTANVSNNIGLVPGGVSGAWGYRRELSGQRRRLQLLLPMSAAGSVTGALLLLVLPAAAFRAVVPVLIALSVLLVLGQPRLAARASRRRDLAGQAGDGLPGEGRQAGSGGVEGGGPARHGSGQDGSGTGRSGSASGGATRRNRAVVMVGVLLAGVYGGYFGAAQGVLLIGILGSLLAETLQRVNGLKNVLSAVVNAVAAVTFVIAAPSVVNWAVVALIAAGSSVGGLLGAWLGRRLPATALRSVVVLVGLIAVFRLVVR